VIILKIPTRGMKRFIFGEIKFITSEFKGRSLLFQNIKKDKKIEEEEEVKENFDLANKNPPSSIDNLEDLSKNKNFIEQFSPTKQTHGFSGLLLDNGIAVTFHTTKPNSNVWGYSQENIPIGDPQNPIKNVNMLQFIPNDIAKKYFIISEPEKMLSSLRYGDCSSNDLIFFAYSAL